MATEVGTAYVTLVPSAKGFASKMQSQIGPEIGRAGTATGTAYGDSVNKSAGSRMKAGASKMFSFLKVAGPLAAVAAGAAIGKVLTGSIAEAREAAQVTARTENVIKSMGNASKISATQVADLAGSLSAKAGMDDEAIQSGENLLLTFGNIRNEAGKGNDIFNQTTGLMVDMSAAMGTDVKGSAIQLGKALNDPVKGVSALTRVGVSFTEQQTNQITKLQESGKTLAAQKIVLGEVKKQFGGAAEAMASPADKAKVAWANFQESIGTVLLPVVDKILTAFADLLPKVLDLAHALGVVLGPIFKEIVTGVQSFVASFKDGSGQAGETKRVIVGAFTDIKAIVAGVVQFVTLVWKLFGDDLLRYAKATFGNIIQIIGGAMRVIHGIIDVVMGLLTGDWSRAWKGVKEILSGAWQVIKAVVKQAIAAVRLILGVAWSLIKHIFGDAWNAIVKLVREGISAVGRLVKAVPGKLVSLLRSLGSMLGNLFRSAWSAAKAKVTEGISNIVSAVKELPGKLLQLGSSFLSAGKSLITSFVDGMKNASGIIGGIAGNVWDTLRGLINGAIDKLNAALEFSISIPGPDIHFNLPDIQHLAVGGRVSHASLAVIGEGREPETVLPDSMLRGLLERTHAAGAAGMAGRLTITNWREGTGYFRLVAGEAVADDARFRRDLGAMHA